MTRAEAEKYQVGTYLIYRIDGQVEQSRLQLGHNVLEQEGLHGALGEDVLPGDEDHLGRPVAGVPVGQRG